MTQVSLPSDNRDRPIPVMGVGSHSTISYSTSTQSSAFTQDTIVRIIASTACHIDVGSNPTATTSEMYLPADTIDYLFIPSGSKIAAVQNASAGTLYITSLS